MIYLSLPNLHVKKKDHLMELHNMVNTQFEDRKGITYQPEDPQSVPSILGIRVRQTPTILMPHFTSVGLRRPVFLL